MFIRFRFSNAMQILVDLLSALLLYNNLSAGIFDIVIPLKTYKIIQQLV